MQTRRLIGYHSQLVHKDTTALQTTEVKYNVVLVRQKPQTISNNYQFNEFINKKLRV